jgi:hypothetical protein
MIPLPTSRVSGASEVDEGRRFDDSITELERERWLSSTEDPLVSRQSSSSAATGSASGSQLGDDDRQRLEEVLGVAVSRVYVFVAGDLNYRLDNISPEQAIRAIARAANDPVRICEWHVGWAAHFWVVSG